MDKKFVIPGVLLWDTEVFNVITATDADFTVNSKRVLNSGDLTPTQNAAAITLDIGSVTTMTSRGVATLPANYKVEVSTSELTIPSFNVTAISGASPSVITLHQTLVKPAHDTVYPMVWLTSAGPIVGRVEFYASNGNIALAKVDGTAFSVPFGPYFDVKLPI
jgi:hypothetical protein